MNTKKIEIIAEAGVNHNGNITIAKKLIDIASESGADYIKFQSFKTELAISKNAKKADYQIAVTKDEETQFEMVKKLELSYKDHLELIKHCEKKKIKFLSTPFDHSSIELLVELGLDIFKVPSGEITNLPYLKHIGSLNKKIFLSTGMSYIGEIENALEVLISSGTKRNNITILHANTEYPTPMEDVNLKAMKTIGKTFKTEYGYSDHSLGIEVPIAAAALGASVIEKHFTLNKSMEGPDHKASLEPDELKSMISAIRNIELALGNGIKKPSKSESKNIEIARKSIVASRSIKKGEIFTEENITAKRPGTGLSPMFWYDVLGKKAKKDYSIDETIKI